MSKNPIYIATVSAPNNIAVIKYWGKADSKWNTPINDSLSVTLDQSDLAAITTVAASLDFTEDRLWLNGQEDESAKNSPRVRACIDGLKQMATDKVDADGTVLVRKQDWLDMHVHISSYNTFPTAAGMASSAAGYAAMVAALAELFGAKEDYPGELTTWARQGSGSACRSLYGGFVAWRQGSPDENWKNSMGQQIADEKHWPELRAVTLVVSSDKKGTSSTAGMQRSVETSLLLQHRASHIVPQRMKDMEAAILDKDFSKFGQLTMADSNQLHAACLDTYPPIFYMNDVSRAIVQLVHAYNDWAGGQIRAAYTFDAGPNAVLFTLEQYAVELGALILHYYPPLANEGFVNKADYFNEIQDYKLDPTLLEATSKTGREPKPGDVKQIYYTQSGAGPQVLPLERSNLDPETGLNTYQP